MTTKNDDLLDLLKKNLVTTTPVQEEDDTVTKPAKEPEVAPDTKSDLDDISVEMDPEIPNVQDTLEPDTGEGTGTGGSRGTDYSQKIDELIQDILNRDPFSYDNEEDPTWQQYRKAYTREGERAMKDAIAAISSRTGGLASSYAATAASQANDYYMSQLADKIPELRDAAYSMYQNNLQNDRQNLQMLESVRADARARIADFLAAKGKIEDLDPDLVSASGYTQAELDALRKAALLNKSSGGVSTVSYSSAGGSYGNSSTQKKSNQNTTTKQTPTPTPPTDQDEEKKKREALEEETKALLLARGDNVYELDKRDKNGETINWVNVAGYGKLDWETFVDYVAQGLVVEKTDYKDIGTGKDKKSYMTSAYWVKA